MYLIPLVLIIINVSCGHGWWLENKDAVQRANDLFIGNLLPSDDQMGFEAAKEARASLRLHKQVDGEAADILKGYLELRTQHEDKMLKCNDTELDKVKNLKDLFSKHSTKPPFEKPRSSFPLIKNFLDLQWNLFNLCSEGLSEKLKKFMHSNRKINGVELTDAFQNMKRFRIFLGKTDPLPSDYRHKLSSDKLGEALSDQKLWELLHDFLTDEAESPDLDANINGVGPKKELARDRFKKLFEATCNLIDQNESLRELLETGMKALEDSTWTFFYYHERAIADYKICIEARKCDLNKVLGEVDQQLRRRKETASTQTLSLEGNFAH